MLLPAPFTRERKAQCKKPAGSPLSSLLKTIVVMKITLFLILACCVQVNANSYAQEVTLSEKNAPLQKIFTEIKKQTGFFFLYTDEMLQEAFPVSISVKKVSLISVLDRIFHDQPLQYTLVDNTIIIKRKKEWPSATSPIAPPPPIIKGVIRDANGTALAGASVAVKGTNNITQTNAQGEFSLDVPDEKAILVISFVGFESQEIAVGNKIEFAIELKAASTQLHDIVVVGYGTQKRANLTGAVDQVSSEALENRSLANLNMGLQGVLPNLNIKPLDGKPNQAPRFNIRGATSIGQGGNALVLIDGVEGDPSLINPNDIASISILKDASSAAIYGARGAFGVVLITTKNPTKGKTSINYTTNQSIKEPTTMPDFVNDAYIYAKMFAESTVAWENTFPQAVNKTLKFSQAYLTELERRQGKGLPEVEVDPVTGEYVYYASTDWFKELYKDHNSSSEHNLTISGSSDKTSFMLTGRYFGQEGLFRYNSDDYRVLNFRAKGSVQVYDWLRFDNNMDYSKMSYYNPLNVGEGGGIWRNIADEGHPLAPMFNPDGTLTASAAYSVGDFWYGKNGIDMERGILRNRAGLTASFFNDKLRLKSDFTFQSTEVGEKRKQVPLPYSSKPGVIAFLGSTTNDIREIKRRTNYFATNIYAEYENTFRESHYLKGLIGYNYEQSTFEGISAQRNGLIYEDANNINLALGQSIQTAGEWDEWAILGGFARLNYIYKDRYLFEVNGRYDGSSKFPEDQRYGFFPSFSAGWRVAKEAFWNISPTIISDLKIRASYGSLGNGSIASYRFQEQFNITQLGLILNGQRPQYTTNPSVLPAGLTWETSTTKNLGLDFAMLSSRLRFSGDVYVRETTDMFTTAVTPPAVFGATAPRGNYADMETKGWEVTLAWNDRFSIADKPFNYDFRVTLADNSAVITKFNNPERRLGDNNYYEGMKLGEIWGYVTDGFFTSTEDIAKHANQKLFLSTSSGQTFPGDIKLKDLNGDGVINPGTGTVNDPGDRMIIGNSAPRYMYGINLGAEWNNIFFSAFFQGVGKQDWWPSTEAGVFWGQYNRPYNKLPRWHLDNHWTPDNTDAYLPRYVSRLANRTGGILREAQTGYLQNISYIRLKNVQLGYNVPARITSKFKTNSLRIYCSAENIWTRSKLYKLTKDLDVENTGVSDQVFSPDGNAGDGYNYPLMKGITFGLSVTF
jgi:TonB-linked SusC/RagA family outer membrane protein